MGEEDSLIAGTKPRAIDEDTSIDESRRNVKGTYIVRAGPFGEMLPLYSREDSCGVISGVEPAGECQQH